MKTSLTSLLLTALLNVVATTNALAQGTAFTYQGRLNDGPSLANGSYDLKFTLFDSLQPNSDTFGRLTNSAVTVSNGLFTTVLDFGPNIFTGHPNFFLEMAVRRAGDGSFITLNPRQRITPTPYALTAFSALKVPGVDGHSLSAADGNPANAVSVDDDGKVGVGTTTPASKLHVISAPQSYVPPRVESTSVGGFSAGWDFYLNGTGIGYVGVPDSGAAFAPRELVLFGGVGSKASVWAGQIRALTADTTGNVGIGTETPAAKLDVRGDIRMGPSGQLRATSSEENLRIVRGVVSKDGTIISGSGFQVSRVFTGRYKITYDTPFANIPALSGILDRETTLGTSTLLKTFGPTVTGTTLELRLSDGTLVDGEFNFIAIGPR